MSIHVQCSCGKQINAREDLAGKRVRCPFCDKVLQVPIPSMETSDFAVQPLPSDYELNVDVSMQQESGPVAKVGRSKSTDSHPKGSRQYKVLTRQDQWFAGTFHPDDLEAALNAYALQGWQLHSVFPVRTPNVEADEVVVVLER